MTVDLFIYFKASIALQTIDISVEISHIFVIYQELSLFLPFCILWCLRLSEFLVLYLIEIEILGWFRCERRQHSTSNPSADAKNCHEGYAHDYF